MPIDSETLVRTQFSPTSASSGSFLRAPSRESRLTLLLFVLAFFGVGIPCSFTYTAAHTLFLRAVGPEGLPFIYIAQAVIIPLAGAACLAAEARLSLRNFVLAVLATDVLALAGLAVGLRFNIPHLEVAAILWCELEAVLNSLALWALAGHLMTLREGKRLFGVIGAGDPLAAIIGGILTPFLLRNLAVGDFFLISAAGSAAAIGLVLIITQRFTGAGEEPETGHASAPVQAAGGRRWWNNPYLLSMMAMAVLSQLAYFTIDNAFYITAGEYFPTEEKLAAFLGVFQACIGVASVTVSLGVSGPLLKRFGVRAGLLFAPFSILAISLAVIGAGAAAGVGVLVGALLFANKVVNHTLRYTLDRASVVTLYQPLSQDIRLRAQASMETLVEPLAAGLAGVLLFALVSWLGFSPTALTGLVVIVAGCWALLAALVHRRYLVTLRGAVAARRLNGGSSLLDDPEGFAHLRRRLESDSPGEVLYCLELLSQHSDGLNPGDILRLLRHPAHEVRKDAARRITQFPRGTFSELLTLVREEADPGVRGALIEAHAETSATDIVSDLTPFLSDADDDLRISAFAGILTHGGIAGMLAAGAALLKLLEAPSAAQRRMGARILGRIGAENVWRPLLPLLTDADADVRLAALETAGRIKAPACLPALMVNLETAGFEHASAASLVDLGPISIPPLMQMFARSGCPHRTRRNIILILGHFGKPAIPVLRDVLPVVDCKLRGSILRVLQRCHHSFAQDAANPFRGYVMREMHAAAQVLAIWRDCRAARNGPAARALARCCEEEITRIQENIFLLLQFNYPDFEEKGAWLSYTHVNAARRAFALEAVETLLTAELRQLLMPLLEGETLDTKQARVPQHDDRPLPMTERLLACALASGEMLLPSTRAFAVFALHESGALTEAARRRLSAVSDPLTRSTIDAIATGPTKYEGATGMLTIEKVLILQQVSIFARIASEHLVELAHSAVPLELGRGDVLMTEGDHGTAMFAIVNGRLRIEKDGVTIAELGPGEVVGEMAALDPGPRSASVTALEDVLLLRIASQDLEYVLMDSPECSRAIIQVLCERLRNGASSR